MRTDVDLFALLDELMDDLQMFYGKFADKKPVMQISLPARRIYAYPYSEYMKTLSRRSKKLLREQYSEAIRRKEMVVFVRDENEKVLKSVSVPIDPVDGTT